MLSSLRSTVVCNEAMIKPSYPNKYDRNQKEDMKKAIELLFEFREKLDELHPDCLIIIESMLQQRRY